MTTPDRALAPSTDHELLIDAYGVQVGVNTSSSAVLQLIQPALPPGWRPAEGGRVSQWFRVTTKDGAFFDVEMEGDETTAACDLDLALEVLDQRIRLYIARNAPENIFIHAGVVAVAGRAIVVPGPAFSGKTTLVSELIRAGAEYFSDEYAVLGRDGLVYPYARPLSVRGADYSSRTHPHPSTFGATAGETPLPIGLVAVTHFQPGATWEPRRLTRGEGVLALLANAVPAQERPQEALELITAAVNSAVILEGERGDAAEVALRLIETVRLQGGTAAA